MQYKVLSMKLSDGSKVLINNIQRRYDNQNKSSELNITIPLDEQSSESVIQKLTESNLSKIEVYGDGKLLNTIIDYSDIQSIDENMDMYNQIITVRAQISSEENKEEQSAGGSLE